MFLGLSKSVCSGYIQIGAPCCWRGVLRLFLCMWPNRYFLWVYGFCDWEVSVMPPQKTDENLVVKS